MRRTSSLAPAATATAATAIPGTPPAGAREPRRAGGERATRVEAGRGGHEPCPFGGNACAKDAVMASPTTGQRPPRDLARAAESGE
ncbi:alpha/beta hydrolase [Actinomadura sp. WMMB 499]|uniref:alpha/beta hydrolase n=1 Tax=Actinomadura sp. WMMB 499 TaxID=1219491 RepID=UPI0012451774|nr:alpha/beta hydrolase [Actinomadura sp. WMMB 499]QFG26226.1 hypothetical protein F7P10_38870 [Actinomadura sp. WMMB 499]